MQDLKKDSLATALFAEFYTDKSFVRLYHALGIDMVKLSFAKIGAHGKGCDIYIKADVFDILCDDILNGDLKKQFLSSKPDPKGYYPNVWEYTTGKKGTKHVYIARGAKKPVVITGYDAETKERVMVTLEAYRDMRIMAKWWKRVSAPYYQKLAMIGFEAKNAFAPKPTADDLAEPDIPDDDLPPVPPMD